MDILAILYPASVGLSEILHSPVLNDGIFSAFGAFVSMTLAYMAGRQLIEPDLRFATVRRFVVLVLLDFASGLYEWKMAQSLYGVFGNRVLGLPMGEAVQLRNGHGRMATVLGGSEPSGIAFGMTFCLHSWLVYLRRVKAPVDLGKTLTTLEKYHVPGLLLLLCVWLTQARGPQISLAAACLILQIPRFKNTKLMTFGVAVLLAGGYVASSAYFSSYTANVSDRTAVTDEQSTAIYRAEMNKQYAPIAEAGGWTGWGALEIPQILGMKSIDNHYLLVHLSWGRLAYILFVLIAWENIRVLLVRSWKFRASQDRAFVFSMLAAMTVLWLTLLTVFLGGQLPEITFLLLGWIQSMVPSKAAKSSGASIAEIRSTKFSFRRVFS